MSAEWLSNTGDMSGRLGSGLQGVLQRLAQPENARRLRRGVLVLLGLWAALALARLVWALFPEPQPLPPPEGELINPLVSEAPAAESASIDIQKMMNWHLFGKAGSPVVPEVVTPPPETIQASALDGIENGARETHLELLLRGVLASSEDGMGHAVIESRKKQDIYAVEDKLPVGPKVKLAKVMPRQVVLDNNGKYELLTLFEDSELDSQAAALPPRMASRPVTRPAPGIDKSQDREATALARSYRERLYQNPQSLAEVVSVAAVRQDGQLRGYRNSPGKDVEQFARLGFKKGDLITGVNGIALNDPANTMKLYQAMRSADEAVFELERDDQQFTINVSLDDTGQ